MKLTNYKKRIGSVVICVGLLAVLYFSANRSTFSMRTGHTSLLPLNDNVTQEQHTLYVDSKLNDQNYPILFNALLRTVKTDNVNITYQSKDTNNGTTINVSYTQVKGKGSYSISSETVQFLLYTTGSDVYCKISNNELTNYYHLTNANYWGKVVNNNSLLDLLTNYEFKNLSYGGKTTIDGKECIKVVADGDAFNQAPVVDKHAVKNTSPADEKVTNNSISDVSNLNVLTQSGLFSFYFDVETKKLKRLAVKEDNSFTTIDIKPIYALTMFADVDNADIEEINEGKLGRLMLSSIFAMVSNSQLNELSPTSVEDTDG